MKRGFWTCTGCGSENSDSATQCLTCPVEREADELTGVTHRHHLASTLLRGRLWRLAEAGPGFVVVAARSRALAEAKGAHLLGSGAQADQTVMVTAVRRRAWLVYVRSALSPYPSEVKPRQRAVPARRATRATMATREPAEGRVYIGRVGVWFDEGYWVVDCADRRIGEVRVHRSDLREPEAAVVRAGQHVSFMIRNTDEALVATDIMVIEPPPAV